MVQSAAAFEEAKKSPTMGLALQIFSYASSAADYGVTADEAEQMLGSTHQAASARFTELVQDRILIKTTKKRPTRNGAPAWVFVLRNGATLEDFLTRKRVKKERQKTARVLSDTETKLLDAAKRFTGAWDTSTPEQRKRLVVTLVQDLVETTQNTDPISG